MKRWIKFVNRKDWQPSSSSHICIKHFEEEYYKKVKNSKRYYLAMNMKPFATIFYPKKVNNKNSEINNSSVFQIRLRQIINFKKIDLGRLLSIK